MDARASYPAAIGCRSSPSARGVLTFPDGRRYGGDVVYVGYLDGVPHGEGALTTPDSEHYEGVWREGKQTGRGVLTKPDDPCPVGRRTGGFAGGEPGSDPAGDMGEGGVMSKRGRWDPGPPAAVESGAGAGSACAAAGDELHGGDDDADAGNAERDHAQRQAGFEVGELGVKIAFQSLDVGLRGEVVAVCAGCVSHYRNGCFDLRLVESSILEALRGGVCVKGGGEQGY